MAFDIRPAGPDDARTIHAFIVGLAVYERAPDAVEVTVEELAAQLASEAPPFECLLAFDGAPAGFALFFHNYSTLRGRAASTSRTCSSPEAIAARASAWRCCGTSPGSRSSAAAAASSGRCSTGTQPAIDFYRGLGAEALDEWTTWRLTGSALAALGR